MCTIVIRIPIGQIPPALIGRSITELERLMVHQRELRVLPLVRSEPRRALEIYVLSACGSSASQRQVQRRVAGPSKRHIQYNLLAVIQLAVLCNTSPCSGRRSPRPTNILDSAFFRGKHTLQLFEEMRQAGFVKVTQKRPPF